MGPDSQRSSSSSTIANIVLLVLVLIALALAYLLYQRYASNDSLYPQGNEIPTPIIDNTIDDTAIPTTSPDPSLKSSIQVDDQPSTPSALIKEVNMLEGGYITIYSLSKDNLITGIVGNSGFLTAGRHQSVKVEFYGPTGEAYTPQPGAVFMVMLNKDNGDKKYGREDVTVPMGDANGMVISKQFKML